MGIGKIFKGHQGQDQGQPRRLQDCLHFLLTIKDAIHTKVHSGTDRTKSSAQNLFLQVHEVQQQKPDLHTRCALNYDTWQDQWIVWFLLINFL